MRKILYKLTGVVLLGVMCYSCEPSEEPFIESEIDAVPTVQNASAIIEDEEFPSYFLDMLANFDTTELNAYELVFTGRTVEGPEGAEKTTFHYLVNGTGQTPQLDSFYLSLPDCAGDLLSWFPNQPTNVSSTSIKWNNSVSKDGSQEYSITFAGNVPPGVISSTVTRGSNAQTYDIVGPCAGVYHLSGSIYIDANNNDEKDASESGIPGYSINLEDEKGQVLGSETTSNDGSYSFMVLAGTYNISVGNDLLDDENYTAGTPTSILLENVSADSGNNNFGYAVDTGKITRELEAGDYNLNTEPTKFWIQQISNAGKKNALYEVEEINKILLAIEEDLLDEPFQFGANKRAGALSILSRPIKTDLEEYLKELLTAELNIQTGRGARDENDNLNVGFNRALLIYAEAVVCSDMGTCPSGEAPTQAAKSDTKRITSSDTKMLASFNGSGGL